MEFLNNLWIAFSTPNEGLINVVLFFGSFIENFLLITIFLSFSDNSSYQNKLKIFICTIINSIFTITTTLFIQNPYNVFINYFAIFLSIKFFFKLSTIKTLVNIICFYIIFALIGSLILNPYLKILNISTFELNIIPIYKTFFLLIMYSITFILSIIIKNRKYRINIIENIDKKNKIIILFNFILGLSTLVLLTIIMFYHINELPIIFGILSFISLLAYFIISIYTLIKANELFKTTEALHSAEEYNKTLQIIHDNVRGFKHDFDNIVMTIGGYIQTNDMEGLKKYYSNLQEDCQSSNTLYMLNPNVVNNPGIFNLLTNKYYKAEEKNIKLNFSFLLDFTKLNMNIYEFTRILGILVDNAIEAASECNEKIVNISFRNEDKNNRQIVLIENTYIDSGIDMNKLFDKGVSGKENHTGLGLWEVRKIVKKHKNLNLYTNKNDKYFIQQLELYN